MQGKTFLILCEKKNYQKIFSKFVEETVSNILTCPSLLNTRSCSCVQWARLSWKSTKKVLLSNKPPNCQPEMFSSEKPTITRTKRSCFWQYWLCTVLRSARSKSRSKGSAASFSRVQTVLEITSYKNCSINLSLYWNKVNDFIR